MNGSREPTPGDDLRDYLAAERTLLAWIRTGLALMGFGFVVARFGLFLQVLQTSQRTLVPSYGLSRWFGTALIAVSVLVNLLAGWRHVKLIRIISPDETRHARSLAVYTSFFLALVGLAMAIYLVSIRQFATSDPSMDAGGDMAPAPPKGIIDRRSHYSVDETVKRLKDLLQAQGVTLFAVIDHSGEAEKVGLKMPPTKLLIFGSPQAGTPLMLAAPSIAIDLPLKILVWEDAQAIVRVAYNSPDYLGDRHGVPRDLLKNIAAVETLAAKVTQ